ncbi:unnamed protein product [Phytophthora fragariaefolia]|uniref:Unnamed protein product n=1 Tax=Phytophthora fragariaefolia TaxID=1490495 RepID=A0A9W7D1J7_9STRA|nr:unnamed protein product [Phytophthora fragariaefolia]
MFCSSLFAVLRSSGSGSDRPLADAGPLSSPRSGGDFTPSGVSRSRAAPVRDPWMPTPSEIESRFGCTAPPSHVEWQALCQSWGAFVENFNKDPAGYRERVSLARERYERFSKRPKIKRLHRGAVEAGFSCVVPMGIAFEHCHVGAVRVSERDINGYRGVRVPEELKALRTNLIVQLTSSDAGGRSTLQRAVGDYSSRSSFSPFGGFGDGGYFEILSNEYEKDLDLGSGSDDQQFAGRSSELPPVRLTAGVEAAGRRRGSGLPGSIDRLEAFNSLQTAEFAALRQELALLKAHIAQDSPTASNVQVDLGSRLAVLRTRVGALEQASAPSHQE